MFDFFGASRISERLFLLLVALFILSSAANSQTTSNTSAPNNAPVISKVEPPNWWLHLTPEVILLLSGRNLESTEVSCNLPTLRVSRTQSSAKGRYLFVWLEIAADTKSGTAVCRINTPTGPTSFELPIAARAPALHRFQGLSSQDVIYLIMPDRFSNGDPTNDEPAHTPAIPSTHDRSNPRAYHGGDLRGILNHLPYLQELGVTTLWLTPIVKNEGAQDYHGYGATDLYAVDPHFGVLADYQELVASAHQQKMKVFFDIVPNHIGPRHPWVSNPSLPDWFHGTPQHHIDSFSPIKGSFYGQPDNRGYDPFESLVDPHMPASLGKNLTEGWFFATLPDLNTENPLVGQYLLQNAIWWAETSGLDGFRIDTFPYVQREFWASWHAGLRKIYPNLTTVGEVFHPDPTVTSFFVGGRKKGFGARSAIDTGLSTVFDYPMYFAMRDVLSNSAPAGRLANILRQDSLYASPDTLVPFFSNHDVPRVAANDSASLNKLKLAFALTLTLRGTPQLYYGDEIAMIGGNDPDNRRDFPGGWPGDANSAFTPEGRSPRQQEIFSYVQTLLQIRREHPALQFGFLTHVASDDASYCFLRATEEERLLVLFNNSSQEHKVKTALNDLLGGEVASIFPIFGGATATVALGQLQISMPPQTLSILVVK